jgi:hypothetical protein
MSRSEIHRRLAAANPLPDRAGEPISHADAQLLAHIVATPRRARRAPVRLVGPVVGIAAAAAGVVAVVALVRVPDSSRHEVEAVGPGAVVSRGAVVHIVARGSGVRVEGWAQPSTGRARIVTVGRNGSLREQIAVSADARVRRWTLGQTEVRRSRALAARERRLVTDRVDELLREAFEGVDRSAILHRGTSTRRVRFAGRPAVETRRIIVVRAAVADRAGGPARLQRQRWFASTFRDAVSGAPLGFQRGVGERVQSGEQLVVQQVIGGQAATANLDWQPVPPSPQALPTATPTPQAPPTMTPTPGPTPATH